MEYGFEMKIISCLYYTWTIYFMIITQLITCANEVMKRKEKHMGQVAKHSADHINGILFKNKNSKSSVEIIILQYNENKQHYNGFKKRGLIEVSLFEKHA